MRRRTLVIAAGLLAAPASAGTIGEHPCSAGEVPGTVAGLYRQEVKKGLGAKILFYDLEQSRFEMINIRTVETNGNQALCKGTLRYELKPSAYALKQAGSQSEFLNAQLGGDTEAQYTVEMTDDGKPFISIY